MDPDPRVGAAAGDAGPARPVGVVVVVPVVLRGDGQGHGGRGGRLAEGPGGCRGRRRGGGFRRRQYDVLLHPHLHLLLHRRLLLFRCPRPGRPRGWTRPPGSSRRNPWSPNDCDSESSSRSASRGHDDEPLGGGGGADGGGGGADHDHDHDDSGLGEAGAFLGGASFSPTSARRRPPPPFLGLRLLWLAPTGSRPA